MLIGWRETGRGIFNCPRVLPGPSNRDGLSLIEILFVLSILGIVISALFFSLTRGEFSSAVSSAKADLQAKVRSIMEWVTKDVRETNLVQIDTNNPTVDHIKFRKVTGIDDTGSYTFADHYIEYNYDNTPAQLTRNKIDVTSGAILQSLVFDNITQSPFYVAVGVPLEQSPSAGNILFYKKLLIVIAGQSQVKNSLTLNFSLTEEVKVRNP